MNLKIILAGLLCFWFQAAVLNPLVPYLNYLDLFLAFVILAMFYHHWHEALFLAFLAGFFQDLAASGFYFYLFLYPLLLLAVAAAQHFFSGEEEWLPHIFVFLGSLSFYLFGFFLLYALGERGFLGLRVLWVILVSSAGNGLFSPALFIPLIKHCGPRTPISNHRGNEK